MKKKRKQSPAQQAASTRNWSKGVISGQIAMQKQLLRKGRLTDDERGQIKMINGLLVNMLKDWKPTI